MNPFGDIKTYIDGSERILSSWVSMAKNHQTSVKMIETGTTIIGLVSPDRKCGIVASDGRATAFPMIIQEDFEKVFDCRIGFIGVAGAVGPIQSLVGHYVIDLETMCNSRGRLMTASGAVRRLLAYANAVQNSVTGELVQFIPLFWDEREKNCHLYKIYGGGFFRVNEGYASIGSGSIVALPNMDRDFNTDQKPLPNTPEEMVSYVKKLLQEVPKRDMGTGNKSFFCGIINNGKFQRIKEVL